MSCSITYNDMPIGSLCLAQVRSVGKDYLNVTSYDGLKGTMPLDHCIDSNHLPNAKDLKDQGVTFLKERFYNGQYLLVALVSRTEYISKEEPAATTFTCLPSVVNATVTKTVLESSEGRVMVAATVISKEMSSKGVLKGYNLSLGNTKGYLPVANTQISDDSPTPLWSDLNPVLINHREVQMEDGERTYTKTTGPVIPYGRNIVDRTVRTMKEGSIIIVKVMKTHGAIAECSILPCDIAKGWSQNKEEEESSINLTSLPLCAGQLVQGVITSIHYKNDKGQFKVVNGTSVAPKRHSLVKMRIMVGSLVGVLTRSNVYHPLQNIEGDCEVGSVPNLKVGDGLWTRVVVVLPVENKEGVRFYSSAVPHLVSFGSMRSLNFSNSIYPLFREKLIFTMKEVTRNRLIGYVSFHTPPTSSQIGSKKLFRRWAAVIPRSEYSVKCTDLTDVVPVGNRTISCRMMVLEQISGIIIASCKPEYQEDRELDRKRADVPVNSAMSDRPIKKMKKDDLEPEEPLTVGFTEDAIVHDQYKTIVKIYFPKRESSLGFLYKADLADNLKIGINVEEAYPKDSVLKVRVMELLEKPDYVKVAKEYCRVSARGSVVDGGSEAVELKEGAIINHGVVTRTGIFGLNLILPIQNPERDYLVRVMMSRIPGDTKFTPETLAEQFPRGLVVGPCYVKMVDHSARRIEISLMSEDRVSRHKTVRATSEEEEEVKTLKEVKDDVSEEEDEGEDSSEEVEEESDAESEEVSKKDTKQKVSKKDVKEPIVEESEESSYESEEESEDNASAEVSDEEDKEKTLKEVPENSSSEEDGEDDSSDTSEDSSESEESEKGAPRPLTNEERRVARLAENKKKRSLEKDTSKVDLSNAKSIDDFERLIISEGMKSEIWIKYMAYFMGLSQLNRAREVSKRSLTKVPIGDEVERNILWTAIVTMEIHFGDRESKEKTIKEALRSTDERKMTVDVAELYLAAGDFRSCIEMFTRASKKYPHNLGVWKHFLQAVYTIVDKSPRMKGKLHPAALKEAREVCKACFKALEDFPKDKITMTTEAARLEFSIREGTIGSNLFESILADSPKRSDVWLQYADCIINSNTPPMISEEGARKGGLIRVRKFFVKATNVEMKVLKLKPLYLKWLEHEKAYGNDEGKSMVKKRAKAMLNK